MKSFREELRRDHGVFLAYELHAWKFVPGRGRPANRAIEKDERAEIFRKTLKFIAESKCFTVVSSCSRTQEYALERLVTRIHNTAVNKKETVLLFLTRAMKSQSPNVLDECAYTTLYRASVGCGPQQAIG